MRLTSAIGYGCGCVLSLGVSQIIGIAGLAAVSIKVIHDKAKKSYYESLLQKHLYLNVQSDSKVEYYKNKINLYSKKITNDKLIAKTSALLLLPILGIPFAIIYGRKGGVALGEELGNSSKRINRWAENLAIQALYPLKNIPAAGLKRWHTKSDRIWRTDFEGMSVQVKTKDKREIDGLWWPKTSNGKNGTAIIFHGNGCTLDDMIGTAEYFHTKGMNILLVTLGGYPNSNENQKQISTETIHLDAEAAVNWVKERTGLSNDKILAYGLSLGGALACHAAAVNPGVHLLTDQTFTTVKGVVGNVLPGFIAPVVQGLAKSVKNLPNNKEAIKQVKGSYFSLYVEKDALMTKNRRRNLAHSLLEIYLANKKQCAIEHVSQYDMEAISARFKGVHGSSFERHDYVTEKLEFHLRQAGLIETAVA